MRKERHDSLSYTRMQTERDEAIQELNELHGRYDLLEADLKEWVDVFRPFGQTPEACLFALQQNDRDVPVDCCEKQEGNPRTEQATNYAWDRRVLDAVSTLKCINHLALLVAERLER